ncbi:MAG: bacteriophage holin [Thermoguttaceae bacterium]
MKLNVLAFGLACGLVWGLGVFCLAWWVMAFEGVTGDPMVLGHLYRGFNISPLGSVIGLVWATVDGFVGGAILAWFYNRFAACLCHCERPTEGGDGPRR